MNQDETKILLIEPDRVVVIESHRQLEQIRDTIVNLSEPEAAPVPDLIKVFSIPMPTPTRRSKRGQRWAQKRFNR